jgi:putative salt-induced outer membrane protein YdiY
MQQRRDRRYLALAALGGILAASTLTVHAQDAAAPAAPAEPKKSKWEASAAVGATLTRGNSKTLLVTGNIQGLRKWDKNELSLGADGAYGENDDVKNTESLHGFVQYNRLFTERFYGYGRVDGLHDGIADIAYRVTLSPGVGYYFIKNDTTYLSGEVGPGAVIEKKGGVEQKYWTLRVAQKFEHKFGKRARVWESLEYLPQVDDFTNYIRNGEIGVDASLTEKLSLTTYLQDTYNNVPAAGRKKNDLRWVTGVRYKFL